MNKRNPCILAAIALLLALAPAFATEATPAAPGSGCTNELTAALPWLQLSVCPQAFCNDDGDCGSCVGGCAGYCAVDGVCRLR